MKETTCVKSFFTVLNSHKFLILCNSLYIFSILVLQKSKKIAYEISHMRSLILVEVMGIEPMSESISTGISPCAADILYFAIDAPVSRLCHWLSRCSLVKSGKVLQGFPAWSMPYLKPTGEF